MVAARTARRARAPAASRLRVLPRLRRLCLAQPGAVEKLSHGEPTWFTRAGGKCFAMFDDHHHGALHVSVYLAAPMDVQRGLVAAEPGRYWVPPYVGGRGWVAAVLDVDPDWTTVGHLVVQAFKLVSAPPGRAHAAVLTAPATGRPRSLARLDAASLLARGRR